jgi:hypothetical protein
LITNITTLTVSASMRTPVMLSMVENGVVILCIYCAD